MDGTVISTSDRLFHDITHCGVLAEEMKAHTISLIYVKEEGAINQH